ncbi:MAG: hypothetical protein PHX08_24220, partial [Lachnospiraceae bacterium]|nr:hypothetical protein [Lachnospiraceae bacterium]
MCANFIIGNIYVNGTPSVKVVQYHRESGSVFPCRWITLSGIYTDEILSSLNGVKEAAVIYQDKKLIAVICPQNGVADYAIHSEIEKYNKKQQIIRRISEIWIRREPLPRTSTGKMKRQELQQEALERKQL